MIKGKGQRLIPEELLKYLEVYKKNHPDPAGGGGATLEDIVDSAGNKRFIEGNGTPLEKEGLTISYCKWSLSGTHLMCVCAGVLALNATINFYASEYLATFTLPSYISEKIYETFTLTPYKIIYSNNTNFVRTDNAANSAVETYLIKDENKIHIGLKLSFTASATDRPFRTQFDLLIDDDYS